MKRLSLTLPTLHENLALDEVLLLQAEEGRGAELLRLWELPHYAVVLGSAGKLHEDVLVDHCECDGIPIGRRSSGGGTVLLGRGCLLYSLILSYESADDLTQIGCSYCHILGTIREALGPFVADIDLAGTSDLAVHGRKISGNSQQRKRDYLLHHGSILYDFDLTQMGRYLKQPVRQPDYRNARSHRDFLMNVPMSRMQIEERLCDVWQATEGTTYQCSNDIERLVRDKYATKKWIKRR